MRRAFAIFRFLNDYSIFSAFCLLVIPLVWCLTSSKAQPVYDTIWKKLRKIAKNMQTDWKIEQFMMDFERAMINSSHEAVNIIQMFLVKFILFLC
jgi:hypothetical protein